MSKSATAILLLAHGGPLDLQEIPAFLQQIFGERPISDALQQDVVERYRLIGGFSPIVGITQSTADKLSRQLDLPVFVGMKFGRPSIEQAVAQMLAHGVQKIIAICMAPHFSEMSIGAYKKKLQAVCAQKGIWIEFVDSWYGEAASIWESRVATLTPSAILFTAHSLPMRQLGPGDPYVWQLKETARLVAQKLGFEQWQLCFQSAPKDAIDWLQPRVEDAVMALSNKGVSEAVVCPIGFVCDHVEILFDLDIALKQYADQLGVKITRCAMPNDEPDLVDALASIAQERLRQTSDRKSKAKPSLLLRA